MTSAMPVQCSNQLSYEVTQLRAGQFVGLMFSREREYNTSFIIFPDENSGVRCQYSKESDKI